jgi:glycosyltransferase involved in cell wall biosynthesis
MSLNDAMIPAPRVTVIMLTYNQERVVASAVESILAQKCEPIQIIISDDCSKDATYEVIQSAVQFYKGPHHLVVRRTPKNLGISDHISELVDMAQGRLIVAAAGDDVSDPFRVDKILKKWESSNEALDLITSDCVEMSELGALGRTLVTADMAGMTVENWIDRRPYVIGATHAFTRRLDAHFGRVSSDVRREDQIMAFRALALGGVGKIPEALVAYRVGGISSGPGDLSGDALRQWAKISLNDEICETRQILKDARRALAPERCIIKLEAKLRKDVFCMGLLGSVGILAMLKCFPGGAGLSVGWRMRKILSFYFFDLHMSLKAFDQARRRKRKGLLHGK